MPLDMAVLYHYPFKSGEGIIKHASGRNATCNNPQYYANYNGTEFDDTAWKQLTRMVPKYRWFG